MQAQRVSRSKRDQTVLDNLSLVKAIAIRVHESLPVHVDLDDLVHAGILGLFDAADKYDAEKNVSFQSYAKHRIKGAILDSLRQLDWASRDLRKRHRKVENTARDLTARLGRAPTEDEMADSMGVDIDRWRRMLVELRNVGLLSASSSGEDGAMLPEFPARPDSRPDSICAHGELRELLTHAMRALPDRYRQVVLLYYTNEMTMKEIGDILGVNESRVSQIHKTALEKMATVLHSSGVHSSSAF